MPPSLTVRCTTCDAICVNLVLYNAGEPGPTTAFMFGQALDDTSVARLSYERPGAAGVRILQSDEVDEVRAALNSGPAAVRVVLPDLVPSTCPQGHAQR